ncbi:chaperonin 10-like protein [Dactylonectria macrodidyma]|uniref:Chaperonin 10-like protein n=1 Tax=Dactylonectria macrodidyma TaxID=307937 RepID=A0A9P9INQ5_9HYPO|nr:chaperonin 10-like protein [Dactylonectria macrodidyma]
MSSIQALPSTCKAACVTNAGPDFQVVVEEVQVPLPAEGEVLVRLSVTGLCFSDIHYMLEVIIRPKMTEFGIRSPGHEGVGTVVAKGSGVSTLSIGDRVGIKPIWSTCSVCRLCCDNREMYCSDALQTGIHKPGTYQQYILSSASHTIKIPTSLEDWAAAPLLCSGTTIYRGLSESGVSAGQWIVISGAGGGVGHLGIQYARAMGLSVIAIDGGEAKRDLCMKLGANDYVDFTKNNDIIAEVLRITEGAGAQAVFVTASNAAAYRDLPGMLRIGGVVMCIGIPPPGTADAGGDPLVLIGKNLKLTGVLVGTRNDVVDALNVAKQANIRPIVEHFRLSDIGTAVAKLRNGNVNGRCVVKFD